MDDSFHIEPVARRWQHKALAFLAAGLKRDMHVAIRAETLGDMLARADAGKHFLQAKRGGVLVAAAMVIPSAGKVGMVFHSPAESRGVETEPLAATLLASADAALGDGLAFVQSLIGHTQRVDAEVLVAGGFERLAELMYMRRDLSRPIDSPNLADLTWQSCEPMDQAELGKVIATTYELSQDCPVLAGLRGSDDVIESHKASGIWRPDCWWIAKLGGVPAGCVLVNDSAASPGDMDLVYMGVGAAFRRRGLGRAMVLRAMQQARRERKQYLRVVVDAANPSARKIYEGNGFVLTGRRDAYIRH